MKMKKLLLSAVVLALFIPLTIAETAKAQWSIGASYEVRNEDPTNGFGVRVERGILGIVPVVDFGMRAHFSYFNESNSASFDNISIDGDITSYDYGLAVLAGINIALVKPYVGLGIGSENFEFDAESGQNSFDESNFYWNGFGGVELNLIPVIKPFLEYRITQLTGTEDVNFDNVGRIAVGVSLRF
jgi:opacity protein-like surface antigen